MGEPFICDESTIETVRLVAPRDPVLLLALEFGRGRNHPPNRVLWLCEQYLSDRAEVEEWNREQVGKALARLADQDLAVRPPPEHSGLYRITPLGQAALVHYYRTGETDIDTVQLMNVDGFDRDEFMEKSEEYSEQGRIADLLAGTDF